MHAAEKGLIAAVDDLGVQEVVWLLVRLPSAARESNFAEALRGIGIDMGHSPICWTSLSAFRRPSTPVSNDAPT